MSDQPVVAGPGQIPGPPNPQGPVFFFTKDGEPIPPPIPVPPQATDLHVLFDPIGGIVVAAWWSSRGLPTPAIPVPQGANDWYFAIHPGLPLPPAVLPPPGVNDFEVFWDGDRIVAAWWTRDGVPIEPIQLGSIPHLHVSARGRSEALRLMAPASLRIADLANVARADIQDAQLVNIAHFEYKITPNRTFHPVTVSHDVFHFRIGTAADVAEVDLFHGGDFRSVHRSVFRYTSPNFGFLKNTLAAVNIDLPEIKTVGEQYGASFLNRYPGALRFYCLSPNLFNGFDGINYPSVFIASDPSRYASPIWTVAFIDVESGAALLGMFDAVVGALIFSATSILPAATLASLAFALWGIPTKWIVYWAMVAALVGTIAALFIAIDTVTLGLGAGATGAAIALAIANSAACWTALLFLVGALGSVLWILNCIITENASGAGAIWQAKWNAVQAKINAALAKLRAATASKNYDDLRDGLSDLKSAEQEEKDLVNDPNSDMNQEQRDELNERIDSAVSSVQSALDKLPSK